MPKKRNFLGTALGTALGVLLVLCCNGCGNSTPQDPAVAEKLSGLSDSDTRQRLIATQWFVAHPNDHAAVLERLLVMVQTDPHQDVRAAAIMALASRKDPETWDVIVAQLQHQAAQVRFAAVEALGKRDPVQARPLVEPLLDDAETTVQQAVIACLSRDQAGNALLIERLRKGHASSPMILASFAQSTAPAAQEAVISAISATDAQVRRAAIRTAGNGRLAKAVPAIASVLTKPRSNEEHADANLAREALLNIADEAACKVLITQLYGDGSDIIKKRLRLCLDRTGPTLRQVLTTSPPSIYAPAIVEILKSDPSEATAQAFLTALETGPLIGALAERLAKDPQRRIQAGKLLRERMQIETTLATKVRLVECLGWVGDENVDGAPILALFQKWFGSMKYSGQDSSGRLATCAMALGRLRYLPAAPILRELLRSNDDGLVILALNTLATMKDPDSVEAAIEALKKGSWEMRSNCLTTVGKFQNQRCFNYLLDEVRNPKTFPDHRILALNGLVATQLPAVPGQLVSLLSATAPSMTFKRESLYFAIVAQGQSAVQPLLELTMSAGAPTDGADPGWWAAGLLRTMIQEKVSGTTESIRKTISLPPPNGLALARLLFALAVDPDAASVGTLIKHLEHSEASIRRHVAILLTENQRIEAISALATAVKREADPKAKETLTQARQSLSSLSASSLLSASTTPRVRSSP